MKVYTKSIKNNSFYEVGTKKNNFQEFPFNIILIHFFLSFFLFFCFQILWWCSRIFLYFSFPQSLLVFYFLFFPPLISIARLQSLLHPQIMVVFPLNLSLSLSLSLSLCVFAANRIFFILTTIKIIKKKILNYHLFSMKNLHCKRKSLGKSGS